MISFTFGIFFGTRSRDQHKTNQHRCKHWSQWLSIVDEALLWNEFRFAGIQRSFHWTVTYTSRSEQGHVATMELSIEAGHAHWKVSTRNIALNMAAVLVAL